MKILENVSLKNYSTMQLGGNARFVCEIVTESDLLEALEWAALKKLPVRTIGDGSNIVWRDEGYDGLLLLMRITDFEVLGDNQVRIGAGMDWDTAVQRAIQKSLSGIELLSLIPGTAGATPVQNVGAYGCEISNVFVSLRAYDIQKSEFITILASECEFGYRTSRFKEQDAGKYVICSITLQLSPHTPQPPFYESLQAYLDQNSITDYNAQAIREAVIAVRMSKLPDPAEVANNGSFFANPIVTQEQFSQLLTKFPDIKGWPNQDGTVKLAAGWLVEQAGFNDYHDKETGMATWAKQNLVLINEHAKTTQDLLDFKQKIVSAVQLKFGVELLQEPELLP